MLKREASGPPPARERLLPAANELFYQEGVQTVGIDRIISHAGVAKASLYSTSAARKSWSAPILSPVTPPPLSGSAGP
jgi:Bacterial regulatory proteins, tetR family